MQTLHTHHPALSRTLHASLHWLGASMVAIVLSACGGSSESTDAPVPPTGPGPSAPASGAASFKLAPAHLGLIVGEEGALVALPSPGAVNWSSSNSAIASVDTQGRVTALTEGSVMITAASGTANASSTVKVYLTTAQTGSALIATALAQNKISAEQALMYRVFSLFGDSRLPAEFDGAPSQSPDHLLLREVSGRLPALSPATQDALTPFMIPPIYAQSWFAQQQSGATARPLSARKSADVTINCFFSQPQLGAARRSTAHFNVHQVFGDELLQGDDDKPTTETVTDFIVSVIEEVYQSETQLFKRFPLPDTNEPCNGGDGALDIYVLPLAGRTKGITFAYPNRCEKVPAYIVLNSNELFLSFGIARNATPLAKKKKEWKSYIAHEFLHAIQFGMDRQAGCDDYKWFDEATAQWVMDHVEPDANFEDGGLGIARSGFARRNGKFFANYLYNDHRVSIENASPESNPELNGYGDYIFFQYLARTYTPDLIKLIFDATAGNGSVEAIASVLDSKGGMKVVWPAFALTLWNDDINKVLDDWSRLDNYDFGLAAIYSPSAEAQQIVASTKLKSLEIDQKSQPRESFKLLKNALPAGEFYEIQPRSMFYEHLKFTDPTVHSVYFSNPIAAFPNREFIKVQVKKKIGGQWQAIEDWTSEPFKQLCLDKKDERVEELLIIVSNSEVNRGTEMPFKIPKFFPMLTSTSNVGCWKWQGTSSTVVTASSPVPVDSIGRGNVTLEVAALLPGRIRFETSEGIVNGSGTGMIGDCTLTSVGAERVARGGVEPDGTIDVNLDLDLGFSEATGEPPDRKLITLSGSALLATTNTLACPTGTTTSTFDESWGWLHTDDPGLYTVSADGQTIEGRFTAVVPGGATITSVWKFTALRE